MHGAYDDITDAARRALAKFDETAELLEYPEVQADKAYYLSVLAEYNALKSIKDKLEELTAALELAGEAEKASGGALCSDASELRETAHALSSELADALGIKGESERAYIRLCLRGGAVAVGERLAELIKAYFIGRCATVSDERDRTTDRKKETEFVIEGAGAVARLRPLVGAHRVYSGAGEDLLCLGLTDAAKPFVLSESDVRIDLFRSSGAGGQHINKTESAVRVTHIPTGVAVTCQDERSQTQNKKRAIAALEKRLAGMTEKAERARIEADIRAQYKNADTPLSFDAERGTMTDKRLKAFIGVAFPPSAELFSTYINGLMTL